MDDQNILEGLELSFNAISLDKNIHEKEDISENNEDRITLGPEYLSKNQQKKLNRYEVISGHKKEKRKYERSRRRERFKERRQNGEKSKEETRKEQIERLIDAQENGIKVCIDLQYATNMSSKEIQRLSNQLKRIYGSNKASLNPFNLTFTCLKKDDVIYKTCVEKITGFEQFHVRMIEGSVRDEHDVCDLVYLSPDATEYLDDLDINKVYVIGGLVDDTVQTQVSLEFTKALGITSRKLPIQLFMERANGGTFKQILTVNQVFDILLKYQETKSWPESLIAGVPARTGFKLKES